MTDDAQTLQGFMDGWALFRTPALAGAVAGAMLGPLGVYIVLRQRVFLSAAVSQAAGLGIVLAFWLGAAAGLALPPLLGAVALTSLVVLGVAIDGRTVSWLSQDALLGTWFLLGAAGTLVLGARVDEAIHDVQSLLFGSAVAVVPSAFTMLCITAAVVLGGLFWGHRGFTLAAFDPAGARVRGVPVAWLDVAFYAGFAVAASVATQVLGGLPTFAFSILPALVAVRIGTHVLAALVWALGLGAGMGFGGYVLAFLWSAPVGASQTLVGLMLVAGLALVLGVQRLLESLLRS